MARIRSIKPAFFRHEGLQDLEASNPGAYPMLVFAGLWTACDRFGRFEWKPRTLKLDILPFLPFDMADTLALLERAGQVKRYESAGKEYGVISSFAEHQRITGKEATSPALFPAPPSSKLSEQLGIAGETTGNHPGAQEGKEEEEGNGEPDPDDSLDASQKENSLPSMAGAVAITLRAKGIATVNSSSPDLIALLKAGVDIGTFAAAADKAVTAGKHSFAYVMGIVKGQAADAARMAEMAAAKPAPRAASPPVTVSSDAAARTAAEQARQEEHGKQSTKPPAEVRAKLAQVTQQLKTA